MYPYDTFSAYTILCLVVGYIVRLFVFWVSVVDLFKHFGAMLVKSLTISIDFKSFVVFSGWPMGFLTESAKYHPKRLENHRKDDV